MSMPKTITKQQAAYQQLRAAIMSGQYQPGTRLVIDKIAVEFGISAIPIRESLGQLEKEGLVEIRPHAGAVVTDIPESAIVEIFAMLEVLETVSCRLGIEKLDASAVSVLENLVSQMEGCADPETWLTLNRNFHESLPRLAGLPRLEEQMVRVGEDWERLRRLRFSDHRGEDKARADRQHRAFLLMLKAKNLPGTVEVIQQHNREALQQYVG
ncbi:MAG: GntR family transcriptional regulator [Kiritimatiellia bacterium]